MDEIDDIIDKMEDLIKSSVESAGYVDLMSSIRIMVCDKVINDHRFNLYEKYVKHGLVASTIEIRSGSRIILFTVIVTNSITRIKIKPIGTVDRNTFIDIADPDMIDKIVKTIDKWARIRFGELQ